MTDEERKMLAFIAGMVEKSAYSSNNIDVNEMLQLQNIVDELGYHQLEEDYFRY